MSNRNNVPERVLPSTETDGKPNKILPPHPTEISNPLTPQDKYNSDPDHARNSLNHIRETYRNTISRLGNKAKEIINKMQGELRTSEKLATRDGVNLSKCQMDKFVQSYLDGMTVEFEAWSPYLRNHINIFTNEIDMEDLEKSDIIGLAINSMLREIFSEARLICLYDELNHSLRESVDAFGRPTENLMDEFGRPVRIKKVDEAGKPILKEEKVNGTSTWVEQWDNVTAPKRKFSEDLQTSYGVLVEDTLRSRGIIRENDKKGEKFKIISESSKVEDAKKLVSKLEEIGMIERDREAIYFVNPEAENPAYQKIRLRKSNGEWECAGLDASSFLDPENNKISHLVILPNSFESQQDQVWEILRVLGIDHTNYHNIFFDDEQPVEAILKVIRGEIEKYLHRKSK